MKRKPYSQNERHNTGVAPYNAGIFIGPCSYKRLPQIWHGLKEKNAFWQLIYTEGNGASIKVNGYKLKLNADNYFLIPFGVETENILQNRVQQLCIHFEAPQAYCRMANSFYRFQVTETEKQIIKSIIAELRPGPDFVTRTGALLCTSFCALSLAKIPAEDLSEVKEDQIIKIIIGQARNRLEKAWRHGNHAKQFGLSPTQLDELFIQQIGITLREYASSMRFARGRSLLENSELDLSRVARLAGILPTEFKQVIKNGTGYDAVEYMNAWRNNS
jgi:AraC-like DNA-binding protein